MSKDPNIKIVHKPNKVYSVYPGMFKTENAARKAAKKRGSNTVIHEPEDDWFGERWYVVRPK